MPGSRVGNLPPPMEPKLKEKIVKSVPAPGPVIVDLYREY
jgi:hypothetical protein